MANVGVVQDDTQRDVPRIVRTVMQYRGKKVTDLARVLYLSHGQISQRLSGKVQFRADELIALGRYLDVEPGVFFLTPQELLRSRCFASLPAVPGQMTLALGVERPQLTAV